MKKNEISRVIRSAATWLAVIAVVVFITCFVVGCTKSDGESETETVTRAIVRLPDGAIVEGNVDKYSCWSNGWLEITMDGSTLERTYPMLLSSRILTRDKHFPL